MPSWHLKELSGSGFLDKGLKLVSLKNSFSSEVRARIFMINLKFNLGLEYEKTDKEKIISQLCNKYGRYLKYPRSHFENFISKSDKIKLLDELSLLNKEPSLSQIQINQLKKTAKTIKSLRSFRAGLLDY